MNDSLQRLFPRVALALAVLVGISAKAGAVEFSPDELKALSDGKIVRKPLKNSCQDGFYGGAGFAVIDAPVDVVWRALGDWRAYPKMFPKTVSVDEVSRKSNRSLLKVLLGYKILSLSYHVSIDRDWDSKTLTFGLAESMPHDINGARGYWKLIPQKDGRTLVAYAVSIRIPSGVVTFLGQKAEKSLERNVIGLPIFLKKYIEVDARGRYGSVASSAN